MSDTTRRGLEATIGRLLTIGTLGSMALVLVGTALLLAAGVSPTDPAPAFAPDRLLADLLALGPAAFLWLGIIGVLATPAARVVAAMVGYWRGGERRMAVVAALILAVIAIGVIAGSAGA